MEELDGALAGALGFNRYIVECKFTFNAKTNANNEVLIDT